jgi:lipopolysaccharide biosynthesis glycosyltransferase
VFVYSTDRHYLPVACISIASLAQACKHRPEVLLLVHDLTATCRRKVEDFCSGLNASVSIRQVDPTPFEKVCAARRQSPAKFAPLLWDQYLDTVPQRIVYIDSDTRVMVDPSDLLTCDLARCPVGAVHDTAVISDNRVGALRQKLELLAGAGYFNSGLLVIDTAGWCDHEVGSRSMHVLNEEMPLLTWNDQCALNKVLDGNWRALPLGWNRLVGSTPTGWPEYIAHFAGTYKPWTVGYMRNLPVMDQLVGSRHLDWYSARADELAWPGFCNLRHQLAATAWTAAALGGEFLSGHLGRHLARSSSPSLKQFAAEHIELLSAHHEAYQSSSALGLEKA